jgi:epoxide hydrolase-like predicted phosphatase
MKQFNNISTIIFDLGGVLCDLDIDQCILNFKRLGLENFEHNLNNFGQSGFFMQLEKGLITAAEFRNEVRKLTSKPLTDAQIDEAWNSFLVGIPSEKLNLILELRKKFRIVLLSNTNIIHFPDTVARFFNYNGMTTSDYFDKCYLSYEMGMAKPDLEIFEAVLADARVKPEECLFLDDGLKNIEQAAKLGIQTYLVDVNEDLSWLVDSL